METNKTELFLDKYRQLEAAITTEYDLSDRDSPIAVLIKKPEFRSLRAELDYCREVRNLLSHNPKVNSSYAVEPSDEIIDLLEQTLQKIQNPTRARHIMVERSKVTCRTMADPVKPAMIVMNKQSFSHIPILREERVCGVFSENTILTCLIENAGLLTGEDTLFSDIAEYLALDSHKSESFRFVPQDMPVGEISLLFDGAQKSSDRIGMLFVTKNGSPSEKLLGILTAWDVAGI